VGKGKKNVESNGRKWEHYEGGKKPSPKKGQSDTGWGRDGTENSLSVFGTEKKQGKRGAKKQRSERFFPESRAVGQSGYRDKEKGKSGIPLKKKRGEPEKYLAT